MRSLFETHFHTAETSVCGSVPAVEGVRAYKEQGYDGIVVTDHYWYGFFDGISGDWNQKAEAWLSGYHTAKAEGERVGVTVLLGMEWRCRESSEDYLVYGFSEQDIFDLPELPELSPAAFCALAHSRGWMVFQAHPFRPHLKRLDSALLDGIEVYNGNPRHQSRNEIAEAFARQNGLLMLSGSDFHEWEDLARGGVFLDEDVKTMADFTAALRKGSPARVETP